MPSATKRLSRVSIAILLASGFAVPAAAGQADYFLKIEGVEGESQAASSDKPRIAVLEVQSWSWGESGAQLGTHAGGGGGGAGKVSMAAEPQARKQLKVEALTIKQGAAAASRANDRLRTAGPRNGDSAAPAPGEAEITLKGAAKPGRPSGDITLKRGSAASGGFSGGVTVASGDVDGDGRTESAAATESGEKGGTEDINIGVGELQEMTISKSTAAGPTLAAPLPAGSILVKAKKPWDGCRVGTRYRSLELGSGAGTAHRLIDAVVTGCGTGSPGTAGDVVPTDQISFNYAKIE